MASAYGSLGCLLLHSRLRPVSSKVLWHLMLIFTHPVVFIHSPNKQTSSHLEPVYYAEPRELHLTSTDHR